MIPIDTHPDILLWLVQEQQQTLWKEAKMQALARQATANRPRSYRRALLALPRGLQAWYASARQGDADAGTVRSRRQLQEASTPPDLSMAKQTMFFQEPLQTPAEEVCTAAVGRTEDASRP